MKRMLTQVASLSVLGTLIAVMPGAASAAD